MFPTRASFDSHPMTKNLNLSVRAYRIRRIREIQWATNDRDFAEGPAAHATLAAETGARHRIGLTAICESGEESETHLIQSAPQTQGELTRHFVPTAGIRYPMHRGSTRVSYLITPP